MTRSVVPPKAELWYTSNKQARHSTIDVSADHPSTRRLAQVRLEHPQSCVILICEAIASLGSLKAVRVFQAFICTLVHRYRTRRGVLGLDYRPRV